ncbi:hypothetical protein CPB86DRAFT_802522 [Serendipita vermifera]|nr:hypothetical protein CPB86DRAFT_802522 [Serendipita vermifera]
MPPSPAQRYSGVPLHTQSTSHRGALRVFAKSLVILFLIVGLCAVTFLYIFLNRSSWDGKAIQTTASLGNVLLLFNLCSKFVLICLPLVMSSAAYHIADGWIKRSHDPAKRDLPTPYQYTLLLGLFSGANIFAAWNAIKYFFRSPTQHPELQQKGKRSNTRVQASYPLEMSFFTLLIALVIAYAIVAIDFSLHELSSAILLPKQSTHVDPKSATYGRAFRDECIQSNPESTSDSPCTVRYGIPRVDEGTNYLDGYQEALRIFLGTSKFSQVISIPYEDSEVAAIVSALDATILGSSYSASTVGMQAQCKSAMNSCEFDAGGILRAGYYCNVTGYPQFIPETRLDRPGGSVYRLRDENPADPVWGSANIIEVPSPNPYVFLFRGQYYTDPSMLETGQRDDLVWARTSENLMSSVTAVCSVTVVDLEYEYHGLNNSYSLKSIAPSENKSMVRAVTVVLDAEQPPFQRSTSSLQSLAAASTSSSDINFLRGLGRTYAESYLPFAHSAFTPIPVTAIEVNLFVEGSLVPTLWLLAYFALLLLFGLLASLQGILALTASGKAVWRPNIVQKGNPSGDSRGKKGSQVNIVQLVADRLTSSIGLLYELFERSDNDEGDVSRSLQGSNIAMFKEGGGANERDQEVRIGAGLKVDRVERFGFIVTSG